MYFSKVIRQGQRRKIVKSSKEKKEIMVLSERCKLTLVTYATQRTNKRNKHHCIKSSSFDLSCTLMY